MDRYPNGNSLLDSLTAPEIITTTAEEQVSSRLRIARTASAGRGVQVAIHATEDLRIPNRLFRPPEEAVVDGSVPHSVKKSEEVVMLSQEYCLALC